MNEDEYDGTGNEKRPIFKGNIEKEVIDCDVCEDEKEVLKLNSNQKKKCNICEKTFKELAL